MVYLPQVIGLAALAAVVGLDLMVKPIKAGVEEEQAFAVSQVAVVMAQAGEVAAREVLNPVAGILMVVVADLRGAVVAALYMMKTVIILVKVGGQAVVAAALDIAHLRLIQAPDLVLELF